MQYRRLGKSGLQVSALSLGSWLTFGKQISDQTAEELMVMAYDNGVNFFDNAEIYARGKSEIVMGNILKKMGWARSSYLVSSKAFFGYEGNRPNQTGLNRKHLVEGCNAALQRLQLDYLDLFFCHRPDPQTPIEETVWAMNHLVQQGKVLYWGTSEWSAEDIAEAHRIARENRLMGPVMEQPEYHMFHRHRVEVEYAPLYQGPGLGTTIWSPLASGLLTGKHLEGVQPDSRLAMKGLEWLRESTLSEERQEKVRGLMQVADGLGTSLPKLAIAWCLANPHVSTVILGASKTVHLKENLEALELLPQLTPEVLQQIEAVLGNRPE
jgi:voltage-dependent potassium channel beta subunit